MRYIADSLCPPEAGPIQAESTAIVLILCSTPPHSTSFHLTPAYSSQSLKFGDTLAGVGLSEPE